jgi:hypothetical protein
MNLHVRDNLNILKTSITDTGTILAGSAILGNAMGNRFGTANGNLAAPTRTNTNVLLYDNGSTNWSGIGSDTAGRMYFVTGTSAPATAMYIETNGVVTMAASVTRMGYRNGNLSAPSSANTNIILFDDGPLSQCGIGVDGSGVFYISTGAGAGVAARFRMDGAGNVTMTGSLTLGTGVPAYLGDCVPLMRGYQERWQAVTAAATTVIDISAGNHVILALNADISGGITLNASLFGVLSGYVIPLILHIVGNGTPHSINWVVSGSGVRWSNGVAPVIQSANGYISRVIIYYMAGYAVFGEQIGYTA